VFYPNFPHMLQACIRKLSEHIGVTFARVALTRDCPLTFQLLRSRRQMTTFTIIGATPARSTLLRPLVASSSYIFDQLFKSVECRGKYLLGVHDYSPESCRSCVWPVTHAPAHHVSGYRLRKYSSS